jgi:superfamily II DNA/RNA helicase
LLSGCDAVIQSETGSGKTAAFLMPTLASLDYPPDIFPDDLDGPQLLVLVPTFELGAQVALLLYKLFGGNISSRTPGDPANMFTYEGPRGIRVSDV